MGAEQYAARPRPVGKPVFQQFGERSTPGTPGGGSGEQGRGQLGNPEIHYEGTPTVTVRLVNGVQQDIPHLYVDSRVGQTRWWVERESIESWQERVRAAKASGDERYKDVSTDRIPSSITHTYPNIPPSVLQRQPEYENREWMTLSYSLSHNQEGKIEEHTFLNTAPSSEDVTTSFRRSLRVVEVPTLAFPESNSDQVFIWRETPEEITMPKYQVAYQGEPKPQTRVEDEDE